MKNFGDGKVRPLPNPAEEQAEELLGFLRSVGCRPSPSSQLIEARLDGLGELGLDDIPECEGFSSSVRQYATNPMALQKTETAGDNVIMEDDEGSPVKLTFVEQLPASAEELMARFGSKPIQPDRLPVTFDSSEIH